MVDKKAPFGMLSSYHQTVFFFRRNKTLFISPTLAPHGTLLLVTLTWMAAAVSMPEVENTAIPIEALKDAQLSLPRHDDVDHHCWDQDAQVQADKNNREFGGVLTRFLHTDIGL